AASGRRGGPARARRPGRARRAARRRAAGSRTPPPRARRRRPSPRRAACARPWPSTLDQRARLELAALLLGLERGRELVDIAGEHARQVAACELHAVVGDPVLREVVGADLLRPLAGADL